MAQMRGCAPLKIEYIERRGYLDTYFECNFTLIAFTASRSHGTCLDIATVNFSRYDPSSLVAKRGKNVSLLFVVLITARARFFREKIRFAWI